uniref:Apple domain-containing protein n=1 Tax=Parastrongyloides trichosuri TaxID=131310 RepID=A0A0N5A433_PARTI
MVNYSIIFLFTTLFILSSCCPRKRVIPNPELPPNSKIPQYERNLDFSGLPSNTWVGTRRFTLMQSMECKGTKITEIANIVDADQCRDACGEYSCMAVNIFQVSEFNFMCEILGEVYSYEPAQGAACYMVDLPLSK